MLRSKKEIQENNKGATRIMVTLGSILFTIVLISAVMYNQTSLLSNRNCLVYSEG